MPQDHTYTALQLSTALGIHKRTVLLKLSGCAPSAPRNIRGQEAKAWAFCELPAEIQLTLDAIAQQPGFRNPEALLRNAEASAPTAIPMQPARESLILHESLGTRLSTFPDTARLNSGERVRAWKWICAHIDSLLKTLPASTDFELQRNERQIKRSLLPFLMRQLPGLVESQDSGAWQRALHRQVAQFRTDGIKDRRSESSGRDPDWLIEGEEEQGSEGSVILPKWFVPAAEFFWDKSNRNKFSGSIPEAIYRTITLPYLPEGWHEPRRRDFLAHIGCAQPPTCPKSLADLITQRQIAGQPIVPERIAQRIRAYKVAVIAERNLRNAELDYLSAPGFSRMLDHKPIRPGQVIEPDDGSINFCVCVPWEFPSNAESVVRYGCLVGRFQLLLMVDACSWFITAFSYVMRPLGTFRQEDVLKLYQTHILEHGKPEFIRHEGGTFNANRVLDCLRLNGIQSWPVSSPHAKAAVEGTFNRLWTKLSVLSDGQIGRFRGEMARENDLLMACRRGSQDPRKVFPDLATALKCIQRAIAECNKTTIDTEIGRWIPEKVWKARLNTANEPVEDPWKFAPYMREWTVKGYNIGGDVRFFEDLSIPFDFQATWLGKFHGEKVRIYFDPFADAQCSATVVLVSDFNGHKAGDVLGEAQQIGGYAQYARQLFGWGSGPDDAGIRQRQMNAKSMKRVVRAVLPEGKPGAALVESQDGLGRVDRAEMNMPVPARVNARAQRINEGDELMRRARLQLQAEESDL